MKRNCAGLFYSKNRDAFLDFLLPVVKVSTQCYHHRDILGIHSLADLLPYRIGVIRGDHAIEHLNQFLPGATLVLYPHNLDAVEPHLKRLGIGAAAH
ncbi:MAG: hypothetical protein KKA54_16585 [Proteobacteria bacterium]|nr:hypothetical protein [Pseudomonadota bacterium]